MTQKTQTNSNNDVCILKVNELSLTFLFLNEKNSRAKLLWNVTHP